MCRQRLEQGEVKAGLARFSCKFEKRFARAIRHRPLGKNPIVLLYSIVLI